MDIRVLPVTLSFNPMNGCYIASTELERRTLVGTGLSPHQADEALTEVVTRCLGHGVPYRLRYDSASDEVWTRAWRQL
jgi:hypothetical protein